MLFGLSHEHDYRKNYCSDGQFVETTDVGTT